MSEPTEKTEVDSPIAQNVRLWMKTLAYPLGIVTGYQSTASIIRNQLYKNVAVTGEFEAAKKAMKVEPLRQAVSNINHPMHHNLPELMSKLNEDYRTFVRHRFKEMGLRNVGDYWQGLNRNQKIEAVVFGMTVTGIVIGSVITMADHRGMLESLTGQTKNGQTTPSK